MKSSCSIYNSRENGTFIFWIVYRFQPFFLAFWVIGNHHFQRIEHAHDTLRDGIEVFACARFEQCHINDILAARNTDFLCKQADRCRRITSPAEPADSRHARIVPAAHVFVLYQLEQLALAHDSVVEVESCKLALFGPALAFLSNIAQEPLIQRAVYFKLQCTDRMRDLFDEIRLPMGKIIHRINAPFVAGAVVMYLADAVHDRVAHVHVGRCHVYFGAEHAVAIVKFAIFHALEQVEVFLYCAVAVRAFRSGNGRRTAHCRYLFGIELADVRFAFFDEQYCPIV